MCSIPGRGWCIPSGRVEPHEQGEEAARREAHEEGGVTLGELRYLGCYRISDGRSTLWAEAYTGDVEELGEIPEGSESSERRLVCPSELPEMYHNWDELTQAMFEYAWTVYSR